MENIDCKIKKVLQIVEENLEITENKLAFIELKSLQPRIVIMEQSLKSISDLAHEIDEYRKSEHHVDSGSLSIKNAMSRPSIV